MALLGSLSSCYQFEVTAQAAYAHLSLDGEIGYENAGSPTPVVAQDIDSAFGLGDDQGTPYARVMLDTGVQVIAVSAFLFEDDGDGVLAADFGDVAAATPVRSEFEMLSAKASYAFQIDLGPVAIAPGIAVDYFDMKIDVRNFFQTESVDVAGPVPMGFLRAEVDLWKIAFVAEAGYMQVDVDDVEASLLDVEALLEVRPTELVHLFAGYRLLDLQLEGEIDDDAFDADIQLGGFFLGGGVRF